VGADAYTAVDLRLGWRPVQDLEIALVGQNVFDRQHEEFAPFFGSSPVALVERSVFIQIILRCGRFCVYTLLSGIDLLHSATSLLFVICHMLLRPFNFHLAYIFG
jgi:hypothetical protein